MSVVAGIFLFIFGGLGTWLLFARYPNARYTRASYVFMALGGLVFVAWAISHVLTVGVAGCVLLLIGGICGAIGWFRKEMRLLPPA
ncbi:MAG TPA: hypothetical protein VFN49_04670 [Candidatus Aquilonibacter sp.]|nr:hypothetical protein [Candidatus Aquilonibacter sp.]